MNNFVTIVSILIYLLCFVMLCYNNRKYIVYICLFYFPQLWMILSCFYIEQGIFLRELNMYTYFTGATVRLVIFNIVFLVALSLFLNIRKKGEYRVSEIAKLKLNMINFTIVCIGIIAILFIINQFISGIVLFNTRGITRFNFWTDYAKIKKIGFFNDYIYIYFIVISYIIVLYKERKVKKNKVIICGIILLILIIYIILGGNKFSLLIYPIVFAMFPIYKYLNEKKYKVITHKTISIVIILIIGFFLLSMAEYIFIDKATNPIQYFLDRVFGMQGQVWWAADNYYNNWGIDSEQLGIEVNNILNRDINNSFVGMKYLMCLLSPTIGASYISKGINFTGGYPAIILIICGYFGVILFNIAYAWIVSNFIKMLDKALTERNIIFVILISKLLYDSFYFYAMGSANRVFNFINIFIVYIYILWRITPRSKSRLRG